VIEKIIKVKSFLLLFAFVLSPIIFPQNIDSLDQSRLYPFVVDSIKITGNETTEKFIILRELNFSIGDTLTYNNSYYNRERVYSLGIFNHVNFIPTVIDNKRILNIEVEESWYIYPIPYLDLKGENSDKLSYGMYLRLKNFRGRNEDLTALISFGYDPAFYLSYYNPNITGTENIFFGSTVGYSDVSNKSQTAAKLYGQDFSQKYISVHLLAGKRFDLFNSLYLSSGFSYIETPFFIPGINASNNRIDNLFNIGLGFGHDTRDLSQFPKDGIYSSLNYSWKGLGIDNINYSVASIDFREYRKLFGDLITKWRLASRFTFGDNIPYYDYSVIGFSEKIRGHYSKRSEGNDYYFGSIEFYYPIIEELNIDLTFIPIIPDQLLSYRVGLYTQIFAETGMAKLKSEPFALNRFNSGYGIGITCLILPYQILRVEVAFDENMKSQLILNLGISF
jgi:outer membrane protein assembly factor BamA